MGEESGGPPSNARIIAGAVGAPLVFAVLWIAPLPLDQDAHRLAAVFGAVVVAWVTEVIPIPVTALLVAPALIATHIATPKDAFGPYADPLLFLFMGSFFIARAMARHGLDQRLASAIVASRLVAGAPERVRLGLVGAAFLLSMWVSNTATAAITMPILLGLSGTSTDAGERRTTSRSLLAIAYACSLGGLGTPVGSPPNLITMRLLREAGVSIGFVDWAIIGLPVGVLGTAAALAILGRAAQPSAVCMNLDSARRAASAPWSRAELVTLSCFALAVVGWTVPGVLQAAHVELGPLGPALDPSVVALVASSMLFMIPARPRGERVLPWRDGVKIDWGVILLFGGGLALGAQLFHTGLSSAIARGFIGMTGVQDLWALTAVVTVFTLFLTELCSNTATATMVVPLVIGMAVELGVSPVPPVLGAGLAASCAFMLPIATGPNAIAYGTGRVDARAMMRGGFWLNVACAAIIVVLLRLLCPILRWD